MPIKIAYILLLIYKEQYTNHFFISIFVIIFVTIFFSNVFAFIYFCFVEPFQEDLQRCKISLKVKVLHIKSFISLPTSADKDYMF